MADNIVSSTVVSVGGYDSSQNHLNLDTNFPGMASDLLNYEVGLNGGYRKISGFQHFDDTYPTVTSGTDVGTGKVLGVFIFNDGATDKIMAARQIDATTNYKFYTYDVGTGWSATGSPTMTVTGVTKVRYAQVNFGNIDYIIFVDGVNTPRVYDGTTWYNLTAAGTGTLGSPGGDQLLEKPATVTVFRNHVFFGADTDFPGVICHLAPESVVNATAAGGAGQIVAGFNVNQIRPFRDSLYVFGKTNIKNVTVSGTDFVLNDTTSNIGCLAPDSVLEIAGDLVFLAPDGVRPISGTDKIGDVQLATVSKQVQQYLKGLIESYDLNLVDGVVIRSKSQMRLFFHDPLDLQNTGVGLIGALRNFDNSTYEFSRLSGFRLSCVTSDYYNDEEIILHGDYDGNIFQQEMGNSFNGENITSIYSTPFLTFGDAKIRKEARTVSVYYRLEGSIEMNINLKFDWNGNSGVLNPGGFTQSNVSETSEYGDGSQYGDGSIYGTIVLNPLLETSIHGSFHSIQIQFTTSDMNPSHSILGFVLEYTTQARR